jgi:hypothetical protein
LYNPNIEGRKKSLLEEIQSLDYLEEEKVRRAKAKLLLCKKSVGGRNPSDLVKKGATLGFFTVVLTLSGGTILFSSLCIMDIILLIKSQ